MSIKLGSGEITVRMFPIKISQFVGVYLAYNFFFTLAVGFRNIVWRYTNPSNYTDVLGDAPWF